MEELALKTNKLTKKFKDKIAVNAVSMHIKKGEIYGFIGKNGAGKTTFMRMVTGLANATNGEIELYGSKDLQLQRKRIGCSIETPAIYPNLTAYENLEATRLLLGIPEKKDIESVLKLIGLEHTKKQKAKNFSLGMKQRLEIGIALLGNPDFLILDEPTNGLDPTGIKEIRELLLKLNKENGITMLISSHILGELSKIATWYGIINNGLLLEEFSKEELDERCKRCLKITVDDVKKATSILETGCHIHNYDVLSDNTIRIFERLEDAANINKMLQQQNVLVQSMACVGQDLESYFVTLMGGEQHD